MAYRVVLFDGPDFDYNYNYVQYQQKKGQLDIIGIVTKYEGLQSIDNIPCLSCKQFVNIEYDYLIILDINNFNRLSNIISCPSFNIKDALMHPGFISDGNIN